MRNFRTILRHISTILFIVSGGGLLLVAPWLAIMTVYSESYFPLMPSIDTRYASGFTEAKFENIQVGMDSVQVLAILGEPYSTYDSKPNRMWAYTGDGGAWWLALDFAWLGREVRFDKTGKVAQRIRHVYYD